MATQNFDGGTSGSYTLSSGNANVYVEDAVYWNKGNLDLNGQYRVKIDAIAPASASGWNYYRINVGGVDYASGSSVVNQNTTSAYVRLYNSSGTATVERDASGGSIDSVIREKNQSTGDTSYTWSPAAMAGTYAWSTVATAPGIGTPSVDGQDVTVTYTNSSSTGGSAITEYKMQYSSNNGSTWSTAVTVSANTHTFTGLADDTTYKFRVYAVNGVGNSAASVSTAVTTDPAVRGRVYENGSWRDLTIGKRYDGSAWVELTAFRRYDGTSWVDLI